MTRTAAHLQRFLGHLPARYRGTITLQRNIRQARALSFQTGIHLKKNTVIIESDQVHEAIIITTE